MRKIFLILALAIFGANSASACAVRDFRVCKAAALVADVPGMPPVVFSEGTNSPGVASEYEWVIGAPSRIHVGDTRYFSDDEVAYLIVHELGHLYYQHGRRTLEALALDADKGLSDLELFKKYRADFERSPSALMAVNHAQEYQADAFSVWVLTKNRMDAPKAMAGVLKNRVTSFSTPSRRQRLERAGTVLATIRATEVDMALAKTLPSYLE